MLNPSFEEHIYCPNSAADIGYPMFEYTVTDWFTSTGGSPDYFHSCGEPFRSIPLNEYGYQYARTGEAYCGLGILTLDLGFGLIFKYYEYLQGRLSAPLQADNRYYVSYWANHGNTYYNPHDKLGIYFSNDSLAMYDFYEELLFTPQIESPSGLIYDDTSAWQKVSGTFVASGGERWFNIGSFVAPEDMTFYYFGPDLVTYYYIDNVCVIGKDSEVKETNVVELCVDLPYEFVIDSDKNLLEWNDGDTSRHKVLTERQTYWYYHISDNCELIIDTIKFQEDSIIQHNWADDLDTILCEYHSLTLEVLNPDFSEYYWSTGDIGNKTTINDPETYWVAGRKGCLIYLDSIHIVYVPTIQLDLPNDTLICNQDQIKIAPVNSFQDSVSSRWNTGQNECCINVSDSGLYVLTITDICNREYSDSILVETTNCDNCLLVPNAFSPNGDGINDFFEIKTICLFKSFTLHIYDRWGNRVFTGFKDDYRWDGTFNGQNCDEGVYYYYIEAVPLVGNRPTIHLKGDITLIR